MGKVYKFHSSEVLPVISARIFGKHGSKLVKLVFDTGAATTQIHTPVIDALGYGAADGFGRMSSHGPAGPIQEGYVLQVEKFRVFGKEFLKPTLAVYDFDNFVNSGLHGLLGFDIIRQLDLELRGSKGELIIF